MQVLLLKDEALFFNLFQKPKLGGPHQQFLMHKISFKHVSVNTIMLSEIQKHPTKYG